ncbi:hypothetical protein D5086_021633 [Populus alba]|uniref:Uncharacterized protein n=1 Tax=Populus alba TaxID=43335 RepID=A0ACC4BCP8_POPAL
MHLICKNWQADFKCSLLKQLFLALPTVVKFTNPLEGEVHDVSYHLGTSIKDFDGCKALQEKTCSKKKLQTSYSTNCKTDLAQRKQVGKEYIPLEQIKW